jgi:hypothetical protein
MRERGASGDRSSGSSKSDVWRLTNRVSILGFIATGFAARLRIVRPRISRRPKRRIEHGAGIREALIDPK